MKNKELYKKNEEMIKFYCIICHNMQKMLTPRGRFRLSSKSYKELKEEGWGLHHSHKIEGKEYYIMAKDNKAIACLSVLNEKTIKPD